MNNGVMVLKIPIVIFFLFCFDGRMEINEEMNMANAYNICLRMGEGVDLFASM